MFVLLGARSKTKVIGPVEKRVCPNCQREDFWELHQLRDWVTLFFLPVIPYKTKHFLVCPVCHLAHPVPADNLERWKEQAERNMSMIKSSSGR